MLSQHSDSSPAGTRPQFCVSAHDDDDDDEYLALAVAFPAGSSVLDRHIVATVIAAGPAASCGLNAWRYKQAL